ncbi:MAG: hypothetical protein JKY54_19815 [Flavobacteriales bacterium]|nr:hypothetical protein [Flavobacteriales bacterium]
MNISLSFPTWYILICVALGLTYAFFFYRKDRLLEDVSRFWRWFLTCFRFATVTILALLILEPLLESISTKLEKPVIVLAHDNSESLIIGKDSVYLKGEYLNQLNQLKKDLGENYEVQTYTFGSQVKEGLNLDYSDKTTNISDLFEEIYTRYYNRNIGAIIIGSDGIYNHGTDPQYPAEKIKNTSVYTIALGDTNARKDLVLTDVAHNRLAYLGNDFPVEVAFKSKDYEEETALVSIKKGGQTIASKYVEISSNDFFTVVPFTLEAGRTGLQKYSISISPLKDELTVENNYKDIFVDVLDSKQRILILAGAPHPDILAIKLAVEQNKNYEVEISLLSDFKGELKEYSLIIGHQVPFESDNSAIYSKIKSAHIPALFIIGSQTKFSAFNAEKNGLLVIGARGMTEAQPITNKGFSLFSMDDGFRRQVEKYPPLSLPFASDYKVSNSAEILFYQKVGAARTKFPLFVFNKTQSNKFGFILGEGIWRWRMADYRDNKSHDRFDNFIGKMIQYLASKEDKSFFRVYSSTDYREDEEVIIDAEVYNESYELVNQSEVQLSLINDEGEEFHYSFDPTSNAYRLNCKKLPKGEYKYTARVDRNGDVFEQTGEFTVSELKIEMINATANHQILFNLADKGNGKLFYPNQLEELKQEILNKKDIVDISYTEKEVTDLINWKWIFFLVLGLLSLEWFIRKRKGAY